MGQSISKHQVIIFKNDKAEAQKELASSDSHLCRHLSFLLGLLYVHGHRLCLYYTGHHLSGSSSFVSIIVVDCTFEASAFVVEEFIVEASAFEADKFGFVVGIVEVERLFCLFAFFDKTFLF